MRKILIVIFIFVSSIGKAQLDYGFIGKKNAISIFADGYFPVTYWLSSEGFPSYNAGSAQQPKRRKKEIFKVNYKVDYTRLLSDKFAVGIELGYKRVRTYMSNVYPENLEVEAFYYYDGNYFSNFIQYGPQFSSISISPNFQLLGFNKIGLSKFSLQLGLGPTFYFIDDKAFYFYTYKFNDGAQILNLAEPKAYYGMNVFMQVTRKFPLFSNIYFDLGFRLGAEFVFGDRDGADTFSPNAKYILSEEQVRGSLNEKLLSQFGSVKFGLSYQF